MKFSYPQAQVLLGRKTQYRDQENPAVSGTLSGANNFRPITKLDKPTTGKKGGKFAGERLQAYLYDEGERRRTTAFNEAFFNGGSDQGLGWMQRRQEIANMRNQQPQNNEEQMS